MKKIKIIKVIIVLVINFFFISHSFAKRSAPQDIHPGKKSGTIVIEQVPPGACTVFVDGEEWPEGRIRLAWKFVLPGKHSIECRSPDGVVFERTIEVEIGRDTPIFWGP